MKKFFYSFIMVFILYILTANPSLCKEKPTFDNNFGKNINAFYARGNDIVIDTNEDGNTVIKWADGSMIVPKNTIVFGGGQSSENETTNITMNNGEILQIIAAGWGSYDNKTEKVNNATITLNGGIVSDFIAGGGAIYSEVNNSNIIINNGKVKEIYGGGLESFIVDNVRYDAGSEDDLKGSKNRVNNVNITINNTGEPSEGIDIETIYGGGCDYAYVGKTNIIINETDMSNTHIVAGGENGYVEESNVIINGAKINSYQNLNKGLVESVTTKVMNGYIDNFYIGSEKNLESKTKSVNEATVYLMEGKIQNLLPGFNNGATFQIDKQKYKILKTKNIDIINNAMQESDLIDLSYKLLVSPNTLTLKPKDSKQIQAIITTIPEGHEDVFEGMIYFETKSPRVATVSDDGVVTGGVLGKTEVLVTFLEDLEIVKIDVTSKKKIITITAILVVIILSIFTTIFYILRSRDN